MAARWSAQLPRWKPHTFDGKVYSLSHLNPRIFSPERYELSLCLPEIIDSMAGRRCYVSNSGRGNHFVIEGLPGLPPGQEYWVFLQIEKVESTVALMRVCSAYSGLRAQAPYGRGRQSTLFRELVARTLDLKKRTPPQGRGS